MNLPPLSYLYMTEEANSYIGCKYDKLGIAGFVIPVGLNEKNAWYCSEICQKILRGLWMKLISPMRFLGLVSERLGFKRIKIENF